MVRESFLTEVTFELRVLVKKEPGMGISGREYFRQETASVKCLQWGISLSYSRGRKTSVGGERSH